jgi:Domain of unknown function (DUF4331)
MSHHFDTPTAREDPRINVCDLYLFQGRPGTTVMAMTVNPDAGVSAPTTFREEAIYSFRFDLDGDHWEDLAFKVRFGNVEHADGDAHKHVQPFEVRRATGPTARKGEEGELVLEGKTEELVRSKSGLSAYAGLAPDLFAGDSAALGAFRNALFKDNKFDPEAFLNKTNFFARRNVTAIVLEVPTPMIGAGKVSCWATASLYGHAPEVQVSRWGLPLITNVFILDMNVREDFNRGVPADDLTKFGAVIGGVAEKLSGLADTSPYPVDYGKQLASRLLPAVLPYELGTPAAFDFAGFNGRALADDTMDVIITLSSNTPLADGVAPDKARVRAEFPYFGEPYSKAEQAGLTPAAAPPPKK